MCCYFVMTTLTTVGYGDLTPQTYSEKIAGIFLIIVGVAFFSYIMGTFGDVLSSYQEKIGSDSNSIAISKWLTSLSIQISLKQIYSTTTRYHNNYLKEFMIIFNTLALMIDFVVWSREMNIYRPCLFPFVKKLQIVLYVLVDPLHVQRFLPAIHRVLSFG